MRRHRELGRVNGAIRRVGSRFPAAGIALLTAIAAMNLCGCPSGTLLHDCTVSLDPSAADWVVVVYMCADNELEAQAIEDLNEMEAVDLAGTGVTVLALLDRGPGHDASNGDWTGTRLYEVTPDPEGLDAVIRSRELALPELGLDPGGPETELNMADPRTLSALLDFAVARYAPSRLGLVIWGHGSGFRADGHTAAPPRPPERAVRPPASYRATCFDDSSEGDALYTAELAEALRGRAVDLVGLDTCFGATVEIAYELRNVADIMVASQDLVPADGWEYDDVLERLAGSDGEPRSCARAIVDAYAAAHADVSSATISAVDLGRADTLVAAFNAFADEVHVAAADPATRDAVRDTVFYDVEDFYATPGDLAIDLGDLAAVVAGEHGIAAAAAAALESAVREAVFASWGGGASPRASGLSVHLIPLGADGTAAAAHDPAYVNGADVAHPLAFVSASTWPPVLPDGPGLLHRLFYEIL
ncbi:MAG: clostripain-related cysteine peptidase [Spirochaetota bacterium]